MNIVKLDKKMKKRVLNGHPWIFENEIKNEKLNFKDGEIVSIFYENNFIGKGFYNSNSKIKIRLLTRKNEMINKEFFNDKIKKAYNYRLNFFKNTDSFRVFYSESDGLSGLIVDKFSDYLVIQINSFGMNEYFTYILDILIDIFNPKGIFRKDDEKICKIENFDFINNWVYKTGPDLIKFKINDIIFNSNIKGQKTGFFLDQRKNSKEMSKYSKDKKVIDLFCYTGNFGLHCLFGGAKHVSFVDYSTEALNLLEKNLETNNIDKSRYTIIKANAFDYLRLLDNSMEKFEIVIIDPPSLAKSRKNKSSAIKGYKELNLRAMKITENEGFLNTSSCTQILYKEDFDKIIFESSLDTNKIVKRVYTGMQSPDHPIDISILETNYLKNYLLNINNKANY